MKIAVKHVLSVALTAGLIQQGHADAVQPTSKYVVPPGIPPGGLESWLIDDKINICTSPWTPMVDCIIGQTHHPSEVTGLFIDMSNLAFQRVGWSQDDYVYTCMEWTGMMSELRSDNGSCYLAAAGVEMSLQNLEAGIQYSWPMYHNRLVILISASSTMGSTWSFLSPFTWQLWTALAASGVMVGAFVWFAEWASTMRAVEGSKFSSLSMKSIANATWQASGRLVQATGQLDAVNTLAARIIVFTYSLLIMVVLATYTANSAALLTTSSLETNIRGMSDLRGKSVGIWENREDAFSGPEYEFSTMPLKWDNKEDEELMISTLRSGRIAALIIAKPFGEAKASDNPDLHVVATVPGHNDDFALAFPRMYPDEDLIANFSRAIKANEEDGLIVSVAERYINSSNEDALIATGGAISLDSMLGLWYIMLGAMGLALVCVAIAHILHCTGTGAKIKKGTVESARKLQSTVGSRLSQGSRRFSRRWSAKSGESTTTTSTLAPGSMRRRGENAFRANYVAPPLQANSFSELQRGSFNSALRDSLHSLRYGSKEDSQPSEVRITISDDPGPPTLSKTVTPTGTASAWPYVTIITDVDTARTNKATPAAAASASLHGIDLY